MNLEAKAPVQRRFMATPKKSRFLCTGHELSARHKEAKCYGRKEDLTILRAKSSTGKQLLLLSLLSFTCLIFFIGDLVSFLDERKEGDNFSKRTAQLAGKTNLWPSSCGLTELCDTEYGKLIEEQEGEQQLNTRIWARHFSIFLGAQANPDANRLYEDLMMTYNKIVRPVANESERVVVKLSLKLSQLIDVVSIFAFKLQRKLRLAKALRLFC